LRIEEYGQNRHCPWHLFDVSINMDFGKSNASVLIFPPLFCLN